MLRVGSGDVSPALSGFHQHFLWLCCTDTEGGGPRVFAAQPKRVGTRASRISQRRLLPSIRNWPARMGLVVIENLCDATLLELRLDIQNWRRLQSCSGVIAKVSMPLEARKNDLPEETPKGIRNAYFQISWMNLPAGDLLTCPLKPQIGDAEAVYLRGRPQCSTLPHRRVGTVPTAFSVPAHGRTGFASRNGSMR